MHPLELSMDGITGIFSSIKNLVLWARSEPLGSTETGD